MSNKFEARKKLGQMSKLLFPDWANCGNCNISTAVTDFHSTHYQKGRGCFPLCQYCWGNLTPAERLPFYMELIDSWVSHGGDNYNGVSWDEIRSRVEIAVLSGL